MYCKLGDLAIIIDSGFEENIGAIVLILSGERATKRAEVDEDFYWHVQSEGRPILCELISESGEVVGTGHRRYCDFIDSWLRPLRPLRPEQQGEETGEQPPRSFGKPLCRSSESMGR